MLENLKDALEELDGKVASLSLEQLEYMIELLELGLSGDTVARIILGEFALLK